MSISALLLSYQACNVPNTYEKNIDTDFKAWNYADTLAFEFDIADTNSRYNLLLNVRHRDVFEWQNLYVRMIITNPLKEVQTREVNIPLCNDEGAWNGNCTGDICFLRVFLSEHKKIFPVSGKYQVLILQDMRVDNLKNILAIGLKIEHSKEKKAAVKNNP